MGEVIAGRFAIEEKIGTGAMGSVHRARDSLTGEIVALKVLHAPKSVRPFASHEIRA